MKKAIHLIISLALLAAITSCKKDTDKTEPPAPVLPPAPSPAEPTYSSKEIYHYSYTSIDGEQVKLSAYKGKKILFVNTASLCSNTPQYEKLEALYRKYSAKLVIIGFPCNQFGEQEPGDAGTIKKFCTGTYQVTFPMAGKIDVSGSKQDSIYTWLTRKDFNGKLSTEVSWNFQKYLVDEKGEFVAMFENYTQPDDATIVAAIEK